MPRWFLSTRAHSVGGPVGPIKVLDADRPGYPFDLTSELVDHARGRELFFAVHGFNVNQNDGIAHLGFWLENLQIGNSVPIGVLWPGDCIVPIFVDYVVEGHEAIESGNLIATFINNQLAGAASLCFASHSLGARVVFQTVSGLTSGRRVRRAVIMAGAIDDNCLTGEYKAASARIDEISILASRCDDVLAMAFPLGNPLQGIIDRGHPYWHAAIGREGPAEPYLPSPHLQLGWEMPDVCNFGHLDYIPSAVIRGQYPIPVEIPGESSPVPPVCPPPGIQPPWKPAWSAAFASTRYHRP